MGQIENVTQELESNVAEPSKKAPTLSEDPNVEHLTPYEHKMGSLTSATDTMVEIPDSRAQNVDNGSTEKSLEKGDKVEPNREGSFEKGEEVEPKLMAHQNGAMDENMGVSPGFAPARSGSELLYTVQIEEDTGSSRRSRKRNAKLKLPVTNSWGLRSKSQERTKSPDPSDNVKESKGNEEKKKRGRKKKQMNKTAVNEFSRTRTHLRYLLHRINFEQNMIDAYSAEGWKGQSLEKLKPEKELERAKSHILRYKLRIRALFQQIDQSLGVGKLPATLFDSQGEIDSEDIFCAKCGSKDLTLDNDIILCDGACERGFHQFCLEPPLLKEHIPPGDEGWLCPGCDCKVDCIDMLKDFQGTKITITDSWEKIFPEAAAAASGKKLLDDSMSSSDDSEDDDYDPDKPDNDEIIGEDELNSEGESSSDESSCSSASDDLVPTQIIEKCLELPSDDSEDDDFDPSAVDQDKQAKQDSSSSDFSSDSEDLGALIEDDTVPDTDSGKILLPSDQRHPSTGPEKENAKVGRKKRPSLRDELSHLTETVGEAVSGRRHVERLDYKKLNDETYGNSSSDSSDEDFDETAAHKRRRASRMETAVVSPNTAHRRRRTSCAETAVVSPNKSSIAMSTPNANDKVLKGRNRLSKRTQEQSGGGITNDGSASANAKQSTHRRLGEAATQRLYASFSQNQYPQKAVKENLAKELGLEVKQVAKWFENTRWSFNHKPQISNSAEKPSRALPTTGMNSAPSTPNVQQPQEQSAANAPSDHKTLMRELPIVITSSSENSGTVKSRKRKGKSKQTPAGPAVTKIIVDQKTVVDMHSPRRTSMRRRNGSSIA